MSLPKDPTKYAAYIEKLRLSHLGKEPGNKGKPSPFKGLTYEEIGRGPSPLTGISRSEEDKQKISAGHLKGKLPTEDRDSILSAEWAYAVKHRDAYICQRCRKHKQDIVKVGKSSTDYMHAHHIKSWKDFPELRFDVQNGITLCHDCHVKEHGWSSLPELVPQEPLKRTAWNKGQTNIELYGWTKAQEISNKLAEAHVGIPSGNKGNPSNYHHSEETRAKMVLASNTEYLRKGKTLVDLFGPEKAAEISKKNSEAAKRTKNHLGHKHSEETKEKIRLAKKKKIKRLPLLV